MRRSAILAVGGVLLFLMAGGGQEPEPPKSQLQKDADAWMYPKADLVKGGDADGRVLQAMLTTADDVETVLKYYDKKCGSRLAGKHDKPSVTSALEIDGKPKVTITADDSSNTVPEKAKGTPRGVTLRQLTRDEPGFFVTVLVTRTKDDTKTHLLVTYLKK